MMGCNVAQKLIAGHLVSGDMTPGEEIGMGQAPATRRPGLRTTPQNFPGRSGAKEDTICLCSPETAMASALTGVIRSPGAARSAGIGYPSYADPAPGEYIVNGRMLSPPLPAGQARQVKPVKGPNIASLPDFDGPPGEIGVPDYDRVEQGAALRLSGLRSRSGTGQLEVEAMTKGQSYSVRHRLSPRQVEMLLAGGLIPVVRGTA